MGTEASGSPLGCRPTVNAHMYTKTNTRSYNSQNSDLGEELLRHMTEGQQVFSAQAEVLSQTASDRAKGGDGSRVRKQGQARGVCVGCRAMCGCRSMCGWLMCRAMCRLMCWLQSNVLAAGQCVAG
jgi:hypothetical protein